MKVRANSIYTYNPCLLDITDGRTSLKAGDRVRVVNLYGCPPANTMGHAHVEDPWTGKFIGLVCTASLHSTERNAKRNANRKARADAMRACGLVSYRTESGAIRWE